MLGDRTKSATTKTTTHDVDAEANHFPCGNLGLAIVTTFGVRVRRVRAAGIGQIEHMVHLSSGQGYGRRVDPHVSRGTSFTMRLHQCSGVAGVGFQVKHTVGMGIQHRIAFDLLVAG